MKLKERKGFIVLAVICIVLCAATIILSVQSAKNESRKLCLVLVIQIQYPPPRPADLTVHSKAVKDWLVYQSRVKLVRELGC